MFSTISWTKKVGLILGAVAISLAGSLAHAQDSSVTGNSSANTWQNYDWLKPAEDQQHQAASDSTFSATTQSSPTDPFTVLSTGSLWQEKYGTVYTRRLNNALSLSCQTSSVALSDGAAAAPPLLDGSDDLSREETTTLRFQPIEEMTLSGNVHDSVNDSLLPADSIVTHGTGLIAESHLPFQSVLTLSLNSDRMESDLSSETTGQSNAYDAQFQQPLGKMPLTAVFKGHYDETTYLGTSGGRMPSLEQSLVWNPAQDTTVKMGLRQQHYEDFPGVPNEFNEAIFADWSQKIVSDVTWHSYAEVLNTRGIQDEMPIVPAVSGINGTPQASTPNPSLNSSLPVSLEDRTLTFSTGPSFRLQDDLSASIEYSNRWDQNPLPGNVGQEQRLSVSIKGTF